MWINQLRDDLGEYGFFQLIQIFDLHGTWENGVSTKEVEYRLAEIRPEIFTYERGNQA